jgi:capsular exopolysaccharide synthesis family protein
MDLPLRNERPPLGPRPVSPGAVRLREGAPLITYLDPPSFAAEQYRALAVQVEERINPIGTWGYALTVTSPEEAAGKTLTSLNLALCLARGDERRVLLIEADLWRPQLHTYLQGSVEGAPGLRHVLEREVALSDAVLSVAGTSLQLLLAGSSEIAGDLVSGRRMSEILAEARAAYEIVILDSPPMAFLASARSLAARSDGVVLVARAGQTQRKGIEKTLSILGPEKTVGIVFNGVKARAGYRGYY